MPFLIFTAVVAIISGGIAAYMASHSRSSATARDAAHANFARAGREACVRSATDARTAARLPVIAEKIDSYCMCAIDGLTDEITTDEIGMLDRDPAHPSPVVSSKIQQSADMCLPRLQ